MLLISCESLPRVLVVLRKEVLPSVLQVSDTKPDYCSSVDQMYSPLPPCFKDYPSLLVFRNVIIIHFEVVSSAWGSMNEHLGFVGL